MVHVKYITAAIILAFGLHAAQASLIYSNSLQSADFAWTVTSGKWSWSIDGLTNTATGENRIFLDALKDVDLSQGYEIRFSSVLNKGDGWGVFFNAGLNASNQVSGYGFQYDPRYSAGAYLLRKWTNNSESVLASSTHKDLQDNSMHDFVIKVSLSAFSVTQDGKEVLSYTKPLGSSGTLVGFRTWSSSVASFKNFSIDDMQASVPEPETLGMMIGMVAFFGKRT